MCWRRRSARARWRRRPTRGSRKGEAGPLEGIPLGDQGPVLHRGRAHHGVLAHPRQFRADLRVDRHRAALARRRGDARQAQQRRIRHGLVERDLVLRPGDHRRGGARARTRRWCRAARPAARRRRSRRISASARPAPTPAARSASRRRSPASSASSRPTAAARAGASSRSRPRSTRPGRSRARCATPRSCCARWPGTTRRTRPASTCRCRTTRRRSASRSRA